MPDERLRLTVVGAAAAYSLRAGWPSSCYLVEAGDDRLLLDIGQGSFGALAAIREPASLGAVFVSHLHPDHGIDLIPLRHYLRYGQHERPPSVPLHGPAGLRRRMDVLFGEAGFLDGVLPGHALRPGKRRVGRLRVDVARVTHTERSFCFRVSLGNGPGLVYSGDCGRGADLLALLRAGDTLLCEASFGEGPAVPGVAHLTADQAAEVAAEGRAARLLLTHLLPETDARASLARARAIFRGPTRLARPGLTVLVP
jgi:ribonuclease BN (tRNA processing enzyme)